MCNCKKYTPENIGLDIKDKKETRYGTSYTINTSKMEDFNDKTENKVRNNADLQGLHRIKVWVDEKYQDLSEILDKFESGKCDCEEKTP